MRTAAPAAAYLGFPIRLALDPVSLSVQFDGQFLQRMPDIRGILLGEIATPLRAYSQRFDFLHEGRGPEGLRPFRVGFEALVFLAGFALGLRVSLLDLFCPLAISGSFPGSCAAGPTRA